jgi:hypothetical protein
LALAAMWILLPALSTAWIPARMAAGIDPQKTLREDLRILGVLLPRNVVAFSTRLVHTTLRT